MEISQFGIRFDISFMQAVPWWYVQAAERALTALHTSMQPLMPDVVDNIEIRPGNGASVSSDIEEDEYQNEDPRQIPPSIKVASFFLFVGITKHDAMQTHSKLNMLLLLLLLLLFGPMLARKCPKFSCLGPFWAQNLESCENFAPFFGKLYFFIVMVGANHKLQIINHISSK